MHANLGKSGLMKHIAVILAGGTGSRVGGQTPKQLMPLGDGRSILEHSVETFEAAPCIEKICIVMHADWIAEAQRMCLQNGWQKVAKIIEGGHERWESSWKAIEAFQSPMTNDQSPITLWFHDAARPFVSQRILADVAEALQEHKAVTVAVPVTDTIYKVKGLQVESIPSRAEYMRAQTPQAFHLETIQTAFDRALASGDILATDDAGIVHKYMPEEPIFIVTGEEANKKITYKEDLNT